MAIKKFRAQVAWQTEISVAEAIRVFGINDLVGVRDGVETNYGQPTRKYLTELDSEESLPEDHVLVAEKDYLVRWEWHGLPDMPVPAGSAQSH